MPLIMYSYQWLQRCIKAPQILLDKACGFLQDDEEAWRDNPFDYEAVPVQTKTDSPQCTSVALLDDRIQACQIECTQSCDSSQEDCRYTRVALLSLWIWACSEYLEIMH